MRVPALALLLLAVGAGASASEDASEDASSEGGAGVRYTFIRRAGGAGAGSARRMFGGREAALGEWGAACALLDRYWRTRCSAAVLAPRWALTAAHCVTPRLAYVRYNTAAAGGDAAPVHYLYRHPGFRVRERDAGRGPDVTLLHHDVGLVRTRAPMRLAHAPAPAPLAALRLYDAAALARAPVRVLGFGRTEDGARGERLYAARLVLAPCERRAWLHCVCGRAEPSGVCAGDSGGPVVYRGAQVAVTSMGPAECAAGRAGPGAAATSVFTALHPYAPLLNATMFETDSALRMTRLGAGARPRAGAAAVAGAAALAAALAGLHSLG